DALPIWTTPQFMMASSLYHLDTAERSLLHNGHGTEPGLKTADGQWDISAHRGRILTIDDEVLGSWRTTLGEETTPLLETPTVYTVNNAAATVLEKLSRPGRNA